MKILIIRFSSIGDIVLASPVFRCVKKQIENVEVHLLTKQSFKMVTEHNPYIDKFFYYSDNLKELIQKLKKEDYDYIIDLHKNIRSIKIKRSLKKKAFTIDKLSIQKLLLTRFKIDIMPNRHITKRSLDTVAPLGVYDDGLGLDYFIPDKDIVKEKDIPTSHHAGYIAIAIGASYYTKKMPLHKLQELCREIEHPIILLGGKEDRETGYEIASVDRIKIYNACGKFSINESADLVRRAKLVLSHDTGMLYIACAFNKRVIAIWGGTSPSLDVEPYYGKLFMQNQPKPMHDNICLNLSCQPCSNFGKSSCPRGHFKCMEQIDVNEIVKLTQSYLTK